MPPAHDDDLEGEGAQQRAGDDDVGRASSTNPKTETHITATITASTTIVSTDRAMRRRGGARIEEGSRSRP